MFLFSKYFVSKKKYDKEHMVGCMAVDHTVTQKALIKEYKDMINTNNIEYRKLKSNLNILKDTTKNQQNQICKLQKDNKKTCNEYQKHSDKQNEKIIKLKKNLKDNVEIYMRNTKKLEDQIHKYRDEKNDIIEKHNVIVRQSNNLINNNAVLSKNIVSTKILDRTFVWSTFIIIVICLYNII